MTGKPGMLQFIISQRVGHNLVTEQQQGGNSYSAPAKSENESG